MNVLPVLSLGFGLGLAACTVPPAATEPVRPVTRTAGTLLSSTPLDGALSVPDAGRAFAITYLATDGVTGAGLVPVTGEVLYPDGPAPAGGWPIVAWAHGTVGIADACAPSRNAHSGRDKTYLGAWLKRGFAIVATDYQGLGGEGTHAYLNTRVEAYSVLDAARAALTGLPALRDAVMIVGQSQGAGAAFAAAAYAPTYAPTLDIRGTVATGIPYFTPQIARALMTSAVNAPSGRGVDPMLGYLLLIGASRAGIDPSFDPATVFTPRAMSAVETASKECLKGVVDKAEADGLTPRNALKPGALDALAPALGTMTFPTLRLSAPLFVGTGTADRDVSPLGQAALVHDACAAGTVVQAHLYKGQDHSQTVLASLPDSAAFTNAVMSGRSVAPACAPVPK
ncbi:hypothetical protein AA103196_1946 [Ameyamaea chiangmaiensis NBRC 103196]|uniref:Alpha/beta hydrolase n=1 Tax=Ameyamaea chiangmaiensis TaxID=442969 RepID=A0A850P3H0_9PROT|nr:lipase family protein [Ameyamaea chiangmaiensis]MBS4073789.1 alpha/beta hydrolase [Ameyamaea chiangmaiensis]NVN39215.1 alpha/beta hydrolase [Ameyamaea chiangmaiensis]GBQ68446.1 hypothetical protein AA103196_1946 [Ameyamaea chiangmaiensis NBRC 103196]